MIFRLLILAGLIFLLFRLVRSLFRPSPSQRRPSQKAPRENAIVSDMVQDPNCGVYVAKNEAFTTRTKDGTLYFCSEECSKKYLERK